MKKTAQRNRRPINHVAKFDRRSGIVRLNVPLSVKAETINEASRTFRGLAATWDVDLGSDIIKKGAFKSSIKQWKSSSEAMPLLNSHDHYDIFAALGQALDMKETDEGLDIEWEVIEGEDGDRVLQRIRPSPRTGRAIIGKMSIGFLPTKFTYEQPEGTSDMWDRVRIINEAELREVSLVLFPMNPGASIDASSVKMFLKMAHDADPKQLDSITRMELRRLNSRIGSLLKKQSTDGDNEQESDNEQPPIAKQKTPSPTASKSTPPVEDDESEEDVITIKADDAKFCPIDGTELNADGVCPECGWPDVDEEEEDDSKGEEDDDTEDKSATPPKDEVKKEDEPKPYIFNEALTQRIASLKLKNKIGEVKS